MMHLLFLSTLVSLSHLNPYPLRSSSNETIPRSNITFRSNGCSKDDAVREICSTSARFQQCVIEKLAFILEESFLISPVLITRAMSLIRYVSMTSIAQRIYNEHFGFPDNECGDIIGMQALVDHLDGYEESGLKIRQGVFASPKLKLRPRFVHHATNGLRANIHRIDFDSTPEREKFVKTWCLDKNDRRAFNYSDTCAPNAEMSLAIANALQLEVKWLHEFEVKNTKMRACNDSHGAPKLVAMMETTGYFRHGLFPEINATFVDLPFKTNEAHNMSMFVIHPKINEIIDVLDYVRNLTIETLLSRGSYSYTTVQVPRFTIQNEVDIKKYLLVSSLHCKSLKVIFENTQNNFTGFDDEVRLRISTVQQKSIIDVTERGVKALSMDGMSFPNTINPDNSTVQHPFYFIIGTTGINPVNLFAGRFDG